MDFSELLGKRGEGSNAYLERYRVISRWNQNVRESLHIIFNAAEDWTMVLIPLSRNTFDSKLKQCTMGTF